MVSIKKSLAAAMIRRSLSDLQLPVEELESKHKDPVSPLFNDGSYFMGQGDNGSWMMVRQAFRTSGKHEYWLVVHMPGKGTFKLNDLDTKEGEGFQLGNLQFTCQTPGKTWGINYSGSIHQGENRHEIDMKLTFEALSPLVNFKDITQPSETAEVIAKEKWNRVFFERLREIKKNHLEQGGKITGTITLDGVGFAVDWISIREHSWGIRNWATWKRHVWLCGVLDNGATFNLSMISYNFLEQISAGYISIGNDLRYFKPLPLMESFVPDILFPDNVKINYTCRNDEDHELTLNTADHLLFNMNDEYFIQEGLGDFILDGIPGKGVAEFGFNPFYYDPPPSK